MSMFLVEMQPAPIDVAYYISRMLSIGADSRYAFAAGGLSAIVRHLSADHAGCSIPGCATCQEIGAGLAIIAALDTLETEGPR